MVGFSRWPPRSVPSPLVRVACIGVFFFLYLSSFSSTPSHPYVQRNVQSECLSIEAPKPSVCVIVRTYWGHQQTLPALILSLASQGYRNLSFHLINTDPKPLGNAEILLTSVRNVLDASRSCLTDSLTLWNISYSDGRKFLNETGWAGVDFGYAQTDLVVNSLLLKSYCDYLLVTNGDNLYLRSFLSYAVEEMRKKVDSGLIAVDYLAKFSRQITTEIRVGAIDLGCVLLRAKFLQQHSLSFVKTCSGNFYAADGLFFVKALQSGATSSIIRRTLFSHQ
jgi:hypothetical protein